MTVLRDNDRQSLGRRYDASDRMDRKLLHNTVDRRDEILQSRALLGLDDILRQPGGLLLSLGQFIKQCALIFGGRPDPGFDQPGNRFPDLAVPALLHQKVLLLADQLLEVGQVLQFRAKFPFGEIFADIDSLLQQGDRLGELVDGGLDGLALGLLLGFLPPDFLELGIVLGRLTGQETAVHFDRVGARSFRRTEIDSRITIPRNGGPQSRGLEPRCHQVVFYMPEFGGRHGRIEFHQRIADLHALAVTDIDRPHHARFEGLYHLGAATRNDLAGRDRDNVNRAECRPAESDAEDRDDDIGKAMAHRRRRRLHNLKRRGQERHLTRMARTLCRPKAGSHSQRTSWSPAWARYKAAYRPPLLIRSSCVPSSTRRPRSMVTIRSVKRSAESLCATMNTVRPSAIRRMFC